MIDSCSAKCSAMEGCKGFTLYNGTLIPDESFNLDPRIMQAGDEVITTDQEISRPGFKITRTEGLDKVWGSVDLGFVRNIRL